MATGYNVRVGDADREAIAAQLREHYADGRLTLDELNERLDQTFAAKTRADLNTVMRDLPYAAQPGVGVGGSGWPGPGLVRADGDAVQLGLPRRPGSAGASRAVHRVRAPDGAGVGLRHS